MYQNVLQSQKVPNFVLVFLRCQEKILHPLNSFQCKLQCLKRCIKILHPLNSFQSKLQCLKLCIPWPAWSGYESSPLPGIIIENFQDANNLIFPMMWARYLSALKHWYKDNFKSEGYLRRGVPLINITMTQLKNVYLKLRLCNSLLKLAFPEGKLTYSSIEVFYELSSLILEKIKQNCR